MFSGQRFTILAMFIIALSWALSSVLIAGSFVSPIMVSSSPQYKLNWGWTERRKERWKEEEGPEFN